VDTCHHGKARLQVADGGTDSNTEGSCEVLNKQSGTADMGWFSSSGVGRGAKNFSSHKLSLL